MKVYIIRHGETTANIKGTHQTPETPLSEKGEKQAHAVAKRFHTIHIDTIFSSPYARAYLTAKAIADILNVSVTILDALKETKKPSEFIGKPKDHPDTLKVKDLMKKYIDNPQYRYSDEETYHEIRQRAITALTTILKAKKENVLVVTHGDVLRMLFAVMMFGKEVDQRTYKKIYTFFHPTNTGITVCEYNNLWEILTFNDYEHLKTIEKMD